MAVEGPGSLHTFQGQAEAEPKSPRQVHSPSHGDRYRPIYKIDASLEELASEDHEGAD